MWWWHPHNPTAYDDDWEDQPKQSPFHQWVLGVAVACLVAGYGVAAIARREVTFGGGMPWTFYDLNAIAYGAAWVSAGVFLHCHYYWGNVYNQAWWAVLGKIIAACGFVAGLLFVLIRNGVFGIE